MLMLALHVHVCLVFKLELSIVSDFKGICEFGVRGKSLGMRLDRVCTTIIIR